MKASLIFVVAAAALAASPAAAQVANTTHTAVKTTTTVHRNVTVTKPAGHRAVVTRRHRACHRTWRNHHRVKVCRMVKVTKRV